MRREVRKGEGSRGDAETVADAPAPSETATFSSAGDLPAVADFGTPGPTASERGFGDDGLASKLPPEVVALIADATADELAMLIDAHADIAEPIVRAAQQLRGHAFVKQAASTTRMHKPVAAPDAHATPAHTPHAPSAPKPLATPADPERARHWLRAKRAAFDQLAAGAPNASSSLVEVRLPDNVVEQLERAWRDSFVGGRLREQGGVLVRKSGSYNIRREDNESPHHFDGDERVGWRETLVAQVHTHPYDRKQVPEGFASFSDGDFDALMRSDANMSVLRSGPFTFMLVKTKQFNALVDRTGNDEDKLQALAQSMTKVYDAAMKATKGTFSQQVEAGVIAVCEQFHLLYFAGEGADLVRRDKQRT